MKLHGVTLNFFFDLAVVMLTFIFLSRLYLRKYKVYICRKLQLCRDNGWDFSVALSWYDIN